MLISFKWASIISGFFILWTVVESFFLNINLIVFKANDISFYGLIFPFALLGIYFGLKEIRRFNDYGYITFKEGIKYGFLITLFVCIFTSVFTFFYFDYLIQILFKINLSKLDEFYFNPFVQSFYQFGYSLASCTISVFIASAMVKNTDKEIKVVDFS